MQAPYCWRWSKHFFFPSRGAYCWNKPRQGNDMNPRPIWTGPYLPALNPKVPCPVLMSPKATPTAPCSRGLTLSPPLHQQQQQHAGAPCASDVRPQQKGKEQGGLLVRSGIIDAGKSRAALSSPLAPTQAAALLTTRFRLSDVGWIGDQSVHAASSIGGRWQPVISWRINARKRGPAGRARSWSSIQCATL